MFILNDINYHSCTVCKQSPCKEGHIVTWVESMPKCRQSVCHNSIIFRRCSFIHDVTKPKVCTFIPSIDGSSEVYTKLKQNLYYFKQI